MKSLVCRFWEYQKERFPVLILVMTTFAVVLSSSTVLRMEPLNWMSIIGATFLGMLELFHIRVIDEFRDFEHDRQFHPQRPVQQGIVNLKELAKIDRIGVAMFVVLTALFGVKAFIFGIVALGFSFVAGKEFFLHEKIRKNFFLYNAINILQMFWLQFLIYAVLDPAFKIGSIPLWTHFAFAFTNSIIIEIVRKIRIPGDESAGRDTYSWHAGFHGSIVLFLVFVVVNYLLFFWNFQLIDRSNTLLLTVSIAALLIVLVASVVHALTKRKRSEHSLVGATLLSYLTLHFVLFLL